MLTRAWACLSVEQSGVAVQNLGSDANMLEPLGRQPLHQLGRGRHRGGGQEHAPQDFAAAGPCWDHVHRHVAVLVPLHAELVFSHVSILPGSSACA